MEVIVGGYLKEEQLTDKGWLLTVEGKENFLDMDMIEFTLHVDAYQDIFEHFKEEEFKELSFLVHYKESPKTTNEELGMPPGIHCDNCHSTDTMYAGNSMWFCNNCENVTEN